MAEGLILSGNRRYLWASESTYGVDAVDAILKDGAKDIVYQQVRNMEIMPEGDTVHVPRVRGSSSGNRHGFIKGRCTVSGEIPLQPFISAAAQVPYAAPILKAMNLKEDLTTASESSYSPSTIQQDSVTIYEFQRAAESNKWRLTVATGVRLAGSISFGVRAEPMITLGDGGGDYFRLSEPAAFFNADGSIALLKDGVTAVTARVGGTETIADQDPMMCISMTATVNAIAQTIESCSLEMNTTVAQVDATTGDSTTVKHVVTRGNADSRIGFGYKITDYTEAALNDHLDNYEAANELAASIVLAGSQGRVTLTIPKMQIGIPAGSDANGMMQYDVPAFLNGDATDLAGDNDFALKFDATP